MSTYHKHLVIPDGARGKSKPDDSLFWMVFAIEQENLVMSLSNVKYCFMCTVQVYGCNVMLTLASCAVVTAD